MPRRRMKHATADKLVFCHEMLHVQTRMQDAGWAADVERWESDSDSVMPLLTRPRPIDETVGTVSEAQLLRLMA